MNDRPRCGRSQVTTARQNRLMVRQYLRNRFTRATETARQTVGTHQRPMSADTVRHRLVASNLKCYRPAREPVLGVSSSGVTSSSLTKVVTASQPQMAEQDCREGEENDIMTTAWRKRMLGAVQASCYGVPSDSTWNLVQLSSIILANGVTALRYIDQVLRPHAVRISHVIKTRRSRRITRVRIQPGQQETSCSRITSMLWTGQL